MSSSQPYSKSAAFNGLNVYTERLRQESTQIIEEELPCDFLGVSEKALSYVGIVQVTGEAYLADEELIVHASLTAKGLIPCSICNEPVQVTIQVGNFYHAESLRTIKSGIFNIGEVIREAIILETPMFAECNQGQCSHRKELAPFLKPDSSSGSSTEKEIEGYYYPFADL